jgi:hypothetical protein
VRDPKAPEVHVFPYAQALEWAPHVDSIISLLQRSHGRPVCTASPSITFGAEISLRVHGQMPWVATAQVTDAVHCRVRVQARAHLPFDCVRIPSATQMRSQLMYFARWPTRAASHIGARFPSHRCDYGARLRAIFN